MGISLPILGVPDLFGGVATLNLIAVTAAPAATVTLQRITPTGADVTIYWGDGNNETIADGETGTTTHEYADAGTYAISIANPAIITYLDIRDAQVGCIAGTIGQLTALTDLLLISVAGVTVGAGEIGLLTNLTFLRLQSVAGVTVGAGEIGLLTSLTDLRLISVAGVTVGAGEIGLLTNLTFLSLQSVANVASQTGFASLLALVTLRYENELIETEVDAVLEDLYGAFPTRTGVNGTIDLLGDGNAAPSGVLQAQCPPTTGLEWAYELVNDSCTVSANHWASVTTA